jgi:hypothetical protein
LETKKVVIIGKKTDFFQTMTKDTGTCVFGDKEGKNVFRFKIIASGKFLT